MVVAIVAGEHEGMTGTIYKLVGDRVIVRLRSDEVLCCAAVMMETFSFVFFNCSCACPREASSSHTLSQAGGCGEI